MLDHNSPPYDLFWWCSLLPLLEASGARGTSSEWASLLQTLLDLVLLLRSPSRRVLQGGGGRMPPPQSVSAAFGAPSGL